MILQKNNAWFLCEKVPFDPSHLELPYKNTLVELIELVEHNTFLKMADIRVGENYSSLEKITAVWAYVIWEKAQIYFKSDSNCNLLVRNRVGVLCHLLHRCTDNKAVLYNCKCWRSFNLKFLLFVKVWFLCHFQSCVCVVFSYSHKVTTDVSLHYLTQAEYTSWVSLTCLE